MLPTGVLMIPHSRLSISPADVRAVSKVLRTGFIAQGREVEAFEADMGKRLGLPAGVAVNSGTAALHLALLALGVRRDDEVILPSYVLSRRCMPSSTRGQPPSLRTAIQIPTTSTPMT